MKFFSRKSDTHREPVSVSSNSFSSFFTGDSLSTPQGRLSEGYQKNPYVRRMSDMYGSFLSSIDTLLYDAKEQEITQKTSPLWRLLQKPNPYTTRREFMNLIGVFLGIHGEAFVYPIQTIKGREWYLVDPITVTHVPSGDPFFPVSYWIVNRGTGGVMNLQPDGLIHIKLSNPDPTDPRGCSPMISARRSIEMQNAIRDWNISTTENGASPSLVVEVPRDLVDEQFEKLVRRMRDSYAGTKNVGKNMILDGGKKLANVGMTAVEMDFIQGLITGAREIAISYGIPPEKGGDPTNKTYSNLEEASREMVRNTVIPLLDLVYDALWADVEGYDPNVARMDYDMEQVKSMMGDQIELYSALASATSYLTANDLRAILGYEPIDDPMADTLLVPMGLIPIGEMSMPPIPRDPPAEEGDAESV
jgi:Phage-related protein